MNKLVTSAIFVMAMMIGAIAFGQETGGSTETGTAVVKTNVAITKNGCVCPSTGDVTSSYIWKNNSFPYDEKPCSGTGFHYTAIPYSGVVYSTETYTGYTPYKVIVNIYPTNKPKGFNSVTSTNIPSVTIYPKSCCLSGAECGCDLNTTE